MEKVKDVPLDMYSEWAAAYFHALSARVSKARVGRSKWISGTIASKYEKEFFQRMETRCQVSIILFVFRPEIHLFDAAVNSVLNQTYENWELILVDDCSVSQSLSTRIQVFQQQDQRIHLITRPVRGGVIAALNDAMDIVSGTLITFLGQEDALVDVALEVMVNAIISGEHLAAYSDEDNIDFDGRLSGPWLKSDFNRRLLLTQDCVGRLLVVRRDILNEIWPMGVNFAAVHDHALALGLEEALGSRPMHHVEEILYHRRKRSIDALSPAEAAAGEACIASHLIRRGQRAVVSVVSGTSRFEVEWRSGLTPTVSIIVTGKFRGADLVAFATDLHQRTDYWRMEVLLAGHDLGLGECGHALHQAPSNIRMLELNSQRSRATLLNDAAAAAAGDYLIFLNDSGLPRRADWLHLLLEEIQAEEDVAVVGCKHLTADGNVQGGAIALGIDGAAAIMHAGLKAFDPGYRNRAASLQDVSAVSLDAMLCKADAFRTVGGFAVDDTPDILLAVGLCTRFHARGQRTIWAPAVLFDHRTFGAELPTTDLPGKGWDKLDAAYNVNFARRGGTFRALAGDGAVHRDL